jgi:pyruvate-ferredoxin/flavodoxin oxidoreductase
MHWLLFNLRRKRTVTPWQLIKRGRACLSNSLFEDNAEFGLGFRIAIDKQIEQCKELLHKLESQIGKELAEALIMADQNSTEEIEQQRCRLKLYGSVEKNRQ